MGITSAYTGSITKGYTKPITPQYTKPITPQYTKPITPQYTAPKVNNTTAMAKSVVNATRQRLAKKAAAVAAARYAVSGARGSANTGKKSYAPNYYTDYNDPYALNSAVDVVFNREAKARALSGIGMGKDFFKKLPVISDLLSIPPAVIDLSYQQSIKPIIGLTKYGYDSTPGDTTAKLKGALSGAGKGATAAGYNALQNVLETMDVVANPVKGSVIEGSKMTKALTGDTLPQFYADKAKRLLTGQFNDKDKTQCGLIAASSIMGMLNATGIGSEGRVNYDYDTGNLGKDILLEFVSDPLNWVSIGAAGAVKGGIKGATKGVVKEMTEELGEKATKKIAKAVAREYLQSASKETLEEIATRVVKNKAVRNLAKDVLSESEEKLGRKAAEELITKTADTRYRKLAAKLINEITKDPSIQATKTLYRASEGIQSGLFKAALATTPLGATTKAIKGARYIGNLLSNKLLRPVDKASLKVFNNLESLITKDFSNTKPDVIQKVKPIIAPITQKTINIYKTASDFIDNTTRFTQTLAKSQEVDMFATVKNTSTLFDDYFKSVSNILDNETYKKLLTTDDYNTLATKYIDLKNQIAENSGLAPDTSLDTIKDTLNKIIQQYTAQIAQISQQYNLTDLQIILDSPIHHYIKLLNDLDEPTQLLVRSIKQNRTKLRYISELTDVFDDYSNSVRDALHKVADKKTLEDTARLFDDAATNPYVNKTVDNRTINEIINRGQAMSAKNLQKVSDLALKEIENGQYHFGKGDVYKFKFANTKDKKTIKALFNEIAYRTTISVRQAGNVKQVTNNMFSTERIGAFDPAAMTNTFKGYHGDNEQVNAFNDVCENLEDSFKKRNKKAATMQALFNDIVDYHAACGAIINAPVGSSIALTDDAVRLYNAIDAVGVDNFAATHYNPAVLLDDDAVVYGIKTSQTLNNLRLLTIPSINTFVDDMFEPESLLTRMLDDIAKRSDAGADTVTTLKIKAKAFVMYRDLADTLLKIKDAPVEAIAGVLDSIATKSNMSIKTFNEYKKFFINEIISKAELNYNQRLNLPSNKLEEVFKRLGGVESGTSHTAMYDCTMTEYIDNAIHAVDAPNIVKVYFDLETLGLKAGTGDIHQIGIHCPTLGLSTDIDMFARATPPEALLKKLKKTTESFNAEFKNTSLPSEDIGIANFFKTLDDIRVRLAKEGKQLVIVGYNNSVFDDVHVVRRARLLGVSDELIDSFRKIPKYDILSAVKANSDAFNFSDNVRNQIQICIEDYADEMAFGAFNKFAQPVDTNLAKAIMDIGDTISTRAAKGVNNNTKGKTLITQYYKQVANDIFGVLNDIKQTNVPLADMLILKSKLPDGATVMNLLTKDVEGVAQYATKKRVDMPQINTFYNIPDSMRVLNKANISGKGGRTLSALTKKAYAMQRTVDRIKVQDFINNNSADISRILDNAILFAERNVPNSAIRFLRNGGSAVYNFAAANHAVKQLRRLRGAALTDFMSKNLDGSAREVYNTLFGTVGTRSSDEIINIFKRASDGTYPTEEQKAQLLHYFDIPENLLDFKFETEAITRELKDYASRDLIYDRLLENKELVATASHKYKAIKDKLAEVWDKYNNIVGTARTTEYLKQLKDADSRVTANIANQHLNRVLKMTPAEKASHIYNNCAGRITFTVNKYFNKQFIDLLDSVHIKTEQHLDTDGVIRVFLIADKNYVDYFKQLPAPKSFDYIKYTGDGSAYTQLISEFRDTLNELQPGMADTLGDSLNTNLVKKIDDKIPADYLRYVIPSDQLAGDGYFNTFRYNQSNIGSIAARRGINEYTASNPMKAYTSSYQNAVATFDNKVQYTGMFFNKDMCINTSPLFKDLPNTELNKFLKAHKEYTCAVIAQDKHCAMGYKIAPIHPVGADAMAKARAMEAIIIPTNQYLKLFDVMNDFSKSSVVLKAINGFVTNTYKMGYLSTLGMVARNLMDGFVKGTIQLNSPLELPKVISHWFDSCRLLKEYDDIYKQLIVKLKEAKRYKLDKDFIDDFFTKDYKRNTKRAMSKDVFNLIHEFISEGPSGGMTAEMDKYFKHVSERLGKTPKAVPGLDKAIYNYQKTVRTVFFPSRLVSNINGAVEQTLRLDQYLTMVENGYTKNKAMQKVIATQFNYDAKPLMQHYVETFLPFTGFTLANYEFYCEQLSNKGWVGGVLSDVMTPVYDLDSLSDPAMYDYDGRIRESVFDEIQQARKNPDAFDWGALLTPNEGTLYMSQGLLYHVLNGNVRWNTHVTDMSDERKELYKVLKLNPSFMDAFQFANNPIGSLQGRLLPIIREADSIINNNPSEYPYKTTASVVLNTLPLVGTVSQRVNAVFKNVKNTKDPAYILSSVFGTSSQFKKSDPDKFSTASKELKNLWYAQYKSNKYKEEYNPYPYTARVYKPKKVYKNAVEKWLAYQFYLFKKNGLPEKYNPYVLYNGLRNPEDQFFKEPFNPDKLNPYASARQVAYWYKLYKENHLSKKYNPYTYYPQYSKQGKGKGGGGKAFDPSNIDPSASAKQVAYWYAMYRTKGLDEKYNPYLYYPQYSSIKYVAFDPSHLDPNATDKQVAYWYAMYKTKGLAEKYNPYTYYPQFAKQTKLFDPAHDYNPDATEKQVKAWYAKFKESGLPELFNPYKYYPQFSLANNTKLFDPAHDFNPKATSAQVAAWYAKFKESGLPETFNPYKYYPQYSKGTSGKKTVSILNPMKLPKHPTEKDISAWYNTYKTLGLSAKYNPYNYYPEFKAKPVKLDLMHLPKNPTSKQIAGWYAWYKANGKDQKYNPYNYYPKLSDKGSTKQTKSTSFSSKGATRSMKSNSIYKNYTRDYSAAAYANKSTRSYTKAYHRTTNLYNKLYSKTGNSRLRTRLDTYSNAKALFYNISNIRYMFNRRWSYFDSKM